MKELAREPLYSDVDVTTRVGGFNAAAPITVASMGSTEIANKHGLAISEGAARCGIPLGIGENVATVWGYAKRVKQNQPCFKERVLTYFESAPVGVGGVVIQQSVEDAYDELWNRVYSDPDFTEHLAKGRLGFEVKLGQGAKPGLGGEIMVERTLALKLKQKFYFPDDPEKIVRPMYERHSAPGTYDREILRSMLRLLKNNYPRARLWVKMGPFRDLGEAIVIGADEGVDAIVVDGKEGGTGMSPMIALKDLGYPTLVCLAEIRRAKRGAASLNAIVSGRLYDGGHIVKSLALGASAVAMGRPFIIAAQAGSAQGVFNFVEAVKAEVQMLTSALGKYALRELGEEDVMAADQEVANMLQIACVYAA